MRIESAKLEQDIEDILTPYAEVFSLHSHGRSKPYCCRCYCNQWEAATSANGSRKEVEWRSRVEWLRKLMQINPEDRYRMEWQHRATSSSPLVTPFI